MFKNLSKTKFTFYGDGSSSLNYDVSKINDIIDLINHLYNSKLTDNSKQHLRYLIKDLGFRLIDLLKDLLLYKQIDNFKKERLCNFIKRLNLNY